MRHIQAGATLHRTVAAVRREAPAWAEPLVKPGCLVCFENHDIQQEASPSGWETGKARVPDWGTQDLGGQGRGGGRCEYCTGEEGGCPVCWDVGCVQIGESPLKPGGFVGSEAAR